MLIRDWLDSWRKRNRARSSLRRLRGEQWRVEVFEDRTLLSGSPVLVKDINTTLITSPGTLGERVDVNGTLFFTVSTPTTGTELWKSDGTPGGTVLVKDILPGPTGSGVAHLTSFNGELYFSASDGVHGVELWKSDGTDAGTVMVTDLYEGASGSSPSSLMNFNGALYFNAVAPESGYGQKLWKTDGTAGGTTLVAQTASGLSYVYASNLTVVDNALYFTAESSFHVGVELWKTDGTAVGTILVKDIYPGTSNSNPSNLTNVNGTLFFTANNGSTGAELWKSDGTEAGTVLVKDILSGSGTSSPFLLTAVNDTLYFRANDGVNGTELWKSDGTDAGTVLVKNLTAGATGSTLSDFVSFGNQLYFAASDGVSGKELWKSDGSEAGTMIVKDIRPGGSSGNVTGIIKVGSNLFFSASDTTGGQELWNSDGSEAGTARVKDIRPGTSNSNPSRLINVGGTLYFQATSGSSGMELWKSDGTDGGTVLMKSFFNGTQDSSPTEFVTIGGTTYFSANDGTSGIELWKTDGTDAGTIRVKDIYSGSASSSPSSLVDVGGILYFSATSSGNGTELWRSDGTDAGTYRVKDIYAGSSSSSPTQLTNINGILYFRANDGTTGSELWRSDGTDAGTFRVKDINPTGNSDPRRFVFMNGFVYFTATDGTTGEELWRTDGTDGGTVRVKDINPGLSGSVVTKLVVVGNSLYFGASDTTHGWELWKSDGTDSGTVLVKDIYASGTTSSEVDELTNLHGILYFRARGTNGRTEIWTSDGTEAGTVPVTAIGYSADSSNISNLTNVNGTIYFLSRDADHGKELWALDPTGAFLVKDLVPGTASPTITDITSLGGILYFVTNDFQSGNELWRSYGTSAGTYAIDAVQPGGAFPQNLRVAGNKLIYSALSDLEGRELYLYDPTPAGVPAPEVQVSWQAQEILDQTGVLDFGNIQLGSTAIRTIKVRNEGTADLVLQPASVPAGFTLLTNFTPGQIVAPGEFTTLTIQLDTTSVVDRDAQLSFGTNDSDEGPFDISLKASVNTPLLYVTPLGPTSLSEADAQPVEVTVTRTYVADISQSLFVNLSSSNTGAMHTPTAVTIPANAISVKVRIYLRNDGEVDGTQMANVSPSVVGFRAQGTTYTVSDDDTPEFRTIGGYLTGTLANHAYHVIQNLQIDYTDTLTVSPGTTLLFDSGTGISAYGKLIAEGTSVLPITLTSGNVSPAPGDWSGIDILTETSSNGAHLSFLNISYATTGISLYSGENAYATITDSEIHDNSGIGIGLSGYGTDAFATITRNHIHHNYLAGISLYGTAGGGSGTLGELYGSASANIDHNEIDHNGGYGVEVESSGSSEYVPFVPSGSATATLKQNFIHHNGGGVLADAYRASGSSVEHASVSLYAYYNVISDNNGSGFALSATSNAGFGAKLVNNTILNNSRKGIVHDDLTDPSDLELKNNLISGNSEGGIVSSVTGWTPNAGLIGYNDVYGNLAGNWIGYPANFGNNTTSNGNGTPADNEFNISVDPVYLAGGDFHLSTASPLINAGVAVTGAPTTDIDGNTIVGLPDIGADEVVSLGLSAPSVPENSPVGTIVGNLSVSDPALAGLVSFSLVDSANYPDNGLFSIFSGSLRTAAEFNYEQKSVYQIKIRAVPPIGPAIDQVLTISILDANEAPVLNRNGNPTLDPIPEDLPANQNSGTRVSDLIARMSPGGAITDPDNGALRGMAIVGAQQTNGTWQFSLDGGTNWFSIGTTSIANSLLISDGPQSRIRFLPNPNFNGSAGFTFFAWDQSSGNNGEIVSTAVRGGATPFSLNSDDVYISVTPVNDAPFLNPAGSPTLNSIRNNLPLANNVGLLVTDLIARMSPQGGISDPDAGALRGIAVNGLEGTSTGTWQFTINNGTTWAPIGTTGNADARLLAADSNTRIRYVPNAGFVGTAQIAFVAWDRTSGVNGGTDNVSNRGGSTPYSSDYDLASMTIQTSLLPNAVGVFRSGKFYLDANNNHVWNNTTGGDQFFAFGSTTDTPLVGDWNGDGITDLGVWRAGKFYLDANGNHTWNNPSGGDALISFGAVTDIPIAGDWNGDGITDIGTFRNGKFYLDANGNRKWDGNSGGDQIVNFGITGDLPIIGDWNGDGTSDIGIFRNGRFYLDANGNRVWNNLAGGDVYFNFGTAGDKPIAGDWNNDGRSDVGVVRGATFYLDANGNRAWNNTTGGDARFNFGAIGDTPVVGLWQVPSALISSESFGAVQSGLEPVYPPSETNGGSGSNVTIPMETLLAPSYVSRLAKSLPDPSLTADSPDQILSNDVLNIIRLNGSDRSCYDPLVEVFMEPFALT